VTTESAPDPWADDVPPPTWFGQRAGCAVAIAAGVVALILMILVLFVVGPLLRGF
jgi:hypothetical protein